MRRRIGLAAAWTAATLVSVFIASQAVGGVRDQVTDRPAALPDIVTTIDAASASPSSTTGAAQGVPTTTLAVASTTTAPAADSPVTSSPQATTAASSSTTTVAPPPETVVTTTAPPSVPTSSSTSTSTSTTSTTSTTTTTTTQVAFDYSQHQLTGGVVVLRSRPGEVWLESASPNPGYTVKVEKTGPSSVEVEFRSETYEGELHAEWRDGVLDVDIEQHAEGEE